MELPNFNTTNPRGLDLCPACHYLVFDHSPNGCELVNGQRWHIDHLLDSVNRDLMADEVRAVVEAVDYGDPLAQYEAWRAERLAR